MTRAPMRPLGYDPETIAPSNVPSFADERPDTRTVYLAHPISREHPALLEAVKRYQRKGWKVVVIDMVLEPMQEAA